MTGLTHKYEINMAHALSFDVEEHFQVSAFWCPIRRGHWDQLESRVEKNTRKLADILAITGVKATFFILGWVAERHPALVRHLADAGHEVASHGYGHELVTAQTPSVFRDDIRRAKAILEDLSGKRVVGYRAPSFSITEQTGWALPILVEEGHLYDSSVYHKFRERYVSGQRAGYSYQIETSAGSLWEVPPSTMKACGVHLPIAGGGYFRLIPYPMLKMFLKRLEKKGAQLVMYLHPWEIDPHQPRMDGPILSRIRHYMNLKKTEQRLGYLLGDFSFGSIVDVIAPLREAYRTARAQRTTSERLNVRVGFDVRHGEGQTMGISPI